MAESTRRYNLRNTKKKPQRVLLKRWEVEYSKLVQAENRRIPLETIRSAIRSAFENSGMEQWRITLKCPLSQQQIRVPARYVDCTHIECFDLETFLQMKMQKNFLVCPICQKQVEKPMANLRIDEYIETVLSELPNAIQVELMPDGTFTNVQELIIAPHVIDDEEPFVRDNNAPGTNKDPKREVKQEEDDYDYIMLSDGEDEFMEEVSIVEMKPIYFIPLNMDIKPNISSESELSHSREEQETQDQHNSFVHKTIRKPSISHNKRCNLDNPFSILNGSPKKKHKKSLSESRHQYAVFDVSSHFDQGLFETTQKCAQNPNQKEVDENQVDINENAQSINETAEAEEGEIIDESDTNSNIGKVHVGNSSIAQQFASAVANPDISRKECRRLKQRLRVALQRKKKAKNDCQIIRAFEDKQVVGPAAEVSTYPGHCLPKTNQGSASNLNDEENDENQTVDENVAAHANFENWKEEMHRRETREKLRIKEGHNILQWTRNYHKTLHHVHECEEALKNNSSLSGKTVKETQKQMENFSKALSRTKNKLDSEKLKWNQKYASKYGEPPSEYTKPTRLPTPPTSAIAGLDVPSDSAQKVSINSLVGYCFVSSNIALNSKWIHAPKRCLFVKTNFLCLEWSVLVTESLIPPVSTSGHTVLVETNQSNVIYPITNFENNTTSLNPVRMKRTIVDDLCSASRNSVGSHKKRCCFKGHMELTMKKFIGWSHLLHNDYRHIFVSNSYMIGGFPFHIEINSNPRAGLPGTNNEYFAPSDRKFGILLVCDYTFPDPTLRLASNFVITFKADNPKFKDHRINCSVVYSTYNRDGGTMVASSFIANPSNGLLGRDETLRIATDVEFIVSKELAQKPRPLSSIII